MRMIKLATGIPFMAAAMLALPLAAMAAPDKPINAATTDSGTFCIVHEADGAPYVGDTECTWHTVTKLDKDGNPQSFTYQDKGNLQDGQTAPDAAVKIAIEGWTVMGLPCTGTEVVTPSGQYSSDLKCK
ncbi:MAG: hypothetical protein R3C08_14535 [Hyphomonas sp.]|nr:hypothetical protein [Hyphomonas sp.]